MKIVILGTAYPYRGGLATFNERLARQFQAEGHDVEVVTFTLQYPSFLFPGKTQYSNEVAPTDLRIKRWVNSCNPFNWVSVGRKIRKMQPDMLITCYWMAFFAPCYGIIERIVKGNGKTRCLALVHNMIPHEPSLLDKLFAPFYVKSTDGFVALSDSVVKDIDKLDKCRKPKTFSPHPIYDHYGERMSKAEACELLKLDADKDYMLFFGLVRAYKGLDLLLDAMGKMHDKLPNLRLLIAGEFYEQEEGYREQIKNLGLTEKVIIRNEFIPDADLRLYFGAADLIVQPYKTATQSGVTQVAFHFEKPMLVTNVGGLGEIVHDHKMGYAVHPNAESIAEAIIDYYENDRQEDYTQYLILEKEKYSWSILTKAFTHIKSLISNC
ncbi:MAG: glycosyltransferase [Paludibacteraceae bacterium]|nr:glycosyltransferase [Paludibacteraceae bacterium]